ncbi:hypothetical protein GGQ13_003041 [Salinibacter ruber]|uniref:hypothetical protein n=1 Tax=Salinibacter ruber TaxID=146919 RepID=UPI00216A4FD7|nr:hypothetical protein [Salinibacter ruber]MCS4139586.1 hypothetical protein [Salinibacter ruber]
MVSLPSNVTTAALALLLGALLGAAGTYYFTSSSTAQPSSSTVAQVGQMEGQGVLDRIRSIAPRDTAGQGEADVEIRYRTDTTRVVDSVYVPIPSRLPKTPAVSSKEPIEVTPDRITWTYFNTAERQWQQRLYAVPERRFEWSAHALVRASVVPQKRLWAGLGMSLRYRRLEASVGALTTPRFGRRRLAFSLRYQLN